MNEQEVYTFIGEVRADLRAIRAMLETHQAEVTDLTKRVVLLETWQANLMGRIVGVSGAIALLATLLGKLLK